MKLKKVMKVVRKVAENESRRREKVSLQMTSLVVGCGWEWEPLKLHPDDDDKNQGPIHEIFLGVWERVAIFSCINLNKFCFLAHHYIARLYTKFELPFFMYERPGKGLASMSHRGRERESC